jgi:hypothetical protein
MKKTILIITFAAMAIGAQAGDWGKAPVGKAPIVDCYDIGGQISTGYMTDYFFRGLRFAEDSVWVDVNYTFDNLAVPVTVGAWYLNGIRPVEFDQLDLYIRAGLGTFAGFDTAIGYTHHFFPEDDSRKFGELGIELRRDLGFVEVILSSNYTFSDGDWRDSNWYHQFGIEKLIPITDSVGFLIEAGVAYSDNYHPRWHMGGPWNQRDNTGWNHYYVTASLPIQLNCRTTLTPYIGLVGSGDGWVADLARTDGDLDRQGDDVHGGVSLSVTF